MAGSGPWLSCPQCGAPRTSAAGCAGCGWVAGGTGAPEPPLPDLLKLPPESSPVPTTRDPTPSIRPSQGGGRSVPTISYTPSVTRLAGTPSRSAGRATPTPGRAGTRDVPTLSLRRPRFDSPDATPTEWSLPAQEAALEWRIRLFALPIALVLAWGVAHAGMSHSLMRIFLSMWVHESGHAVTAWLCGLPAFPGPWFTPVAAQRSAILALCLAALLVFFGQRAWRRQHRVVAGLCGALLLLQGLGTLGLSLRRAQEWMIFGGDAGCLVLGTMLMATLYVRRGHVLRRDWLRWGFLVIGAAAFCDAYATWWAARKSFDAIPFGENEGSGPSDPSRLVDQYGWTPGDLVHRYLVLGALCLVTLGVVYLLGLRRRESAAVEAHAEQ